MLISGWPTPSRGLSRRAQLLHHRHQLIEVGLIDQQRAIPGIEF